MNRENVFRTTTKQINKNLVFPMQLRKHPPCLGKFGWPVAPAKCTECDYEKICRRDVVEKNIIAHKHVLYSTVDFRIDRAALRFTEAGKTAVFNLCKELAGRKFRMTLGKTGGTIERIPKELTTVFTARLLNILCSEGNTEKTPIIVEL